MPEANEPNHFLRIVGWWVLTTVIFTPLVVFVLAPGIPPGNGSVEASGQVTDNTVLLGLSVPVAAAVLVYLAYALIVFRERDPAVVVDGPPVRGNASVQLWWLVTTTVLVLVLAGYGTIRLLADGSGGGQGPNPIAVPASAKADPPLQVQVIAQQWAFTYRFPGYGGVETDHLYLPVEHHRRAPRDLSRRDPLVLGLRARGQGRRQPRGRQRGLRRRPRGRLPSTSTAPSCAACGTATCSTTPTWSARRSSRRGFASSGWPTRRRPKLLPPYSKRTSRTHRGEAG